MITDMRYTDWPQNILDEIGITPEDPLETLGDAGNIEVAMILARLSEKEKGILRQRYIDNKSIEDIGKAYGMDAEPIRKAIEKALRRLRTNNASKEVLLYGTRGYVERRIESEIQRRVSIRVADLEKEYRLRIQRLTRGFSEEEKHLDDYQEVLGQPLESLNLSVRSYKCLRWFGECVTIRDVIEKYPTREDALALRNLGAHSVDEISYRLAVKGVKWPLEKKKE